VSNHFLRVTQQQSTVAAQADLVQRIQLEFGRKFPVANQAVVLEAFWLNEIDYLSQEPEYNTAYLDGSSLS
jgi:hypothetical protein